MQPHRIEQLMPPSLQPLLLSAHVASTPPQHRVRETIARRKTTRIRHQTVGASGLRSISPRTPSAVVVVVMVTAMPLTAIAKVAAAAPPTTPPPSQSAAPWPRNRPLCSRRVSLLLAVLAFGVLINRSDADGVGATQVVNEQINVTRSSGAVSARDDGVINGTTTTRQTDVTQRSTVAMLRPTATAPLAPPVAVAVFVKSVQPVNQHHMQQQQQQQQQQQPSAGDAVNEDYYFDGDSEDNEYINLISNKSAKGMYIGAPCEQTCAERLHHVVCEAAIGKCACERNYPVAIGLTKGCAKSKKLDEQCFYHETCAHSDPNSLCVQVKHNALCQCADGFHSVTYSKPTKRIFCTQDMSVLTSDLPTLLGVSSGIAVLAGLICMVLHLFSKTKYPRHRNYADANIPPPIMYSTDTEIPLTVHSGRPSSRSSLRSSNSISSYSQRRPSSAPHSGSKGVLVSSSRSGSRRPSLASVHSTSSSIKSYSMQRIEKELQQKELRQEMKLRLARLQHNQGLNKPQIIIIGGGGISGSTVQTTATTATTTMMMMPSPASGVGLEAIGIASNMSTSSSIGGSSINNGAFGVSGTGVGGGGGGVLAGRGLEYALGQPHLQQQQQQSQTSSGVPLYGQYGQHNHHHHHHGGSSSGGGAGGPINYLGNAHNTHHHVAFMVDPLMHQHVVLSKNCNATAHTPSPLTPNSTDELLPSVDEAQEFSPPQSVHGADDGAYIGPCLSSEALLE